ncbi:MAG: hypothetical protein ACRD2E_13885 [Terriglobales bacterium]
MPRAVALRAGLILALLAALELPSLGQTYLPHWTGDVGFGVAPVVGGIGKDLSTGWDFTAAFGRRLSRQLALQGEFDYDSLGVTGQALQALKMPAGAADLWSLSAEPVWTFRRGKLGWFVKGGVGYYRRTVRFLQPTFTSTFIFNPWWGYIGPALVPADIILGAVSENAFGANGGFGISARLPRSNGARVFVEVDYRWAHTQPTTTTLLPVTLGIRW